MTDLLMTAVEYYHNITNSGNSSNGYILDRAFAVTYLEQADAATFTRLLRSG